MNMRERATHAAKLLAQEPPPLDTLLYLGEVFGLKQREIKLLGHLASGLTMLEIATAMGLTVGSARMYVKGVLWKTGAGSQAQLVRLVYRAQGGMAA